MKLLSLGGGNAAGQFTVDSLRDIGTKESASAISAAGYDGVMFDVEEVIGPSNATIPAFSTAFATLKQAGFVIGVTISHSAPYATDIPQDAVDLMKAFVADENIDIFAPQLYSSGEEAAPVFDETAQCVDEGCTWDIFKGMAASATFAPSIVQDSHYAPTIEYFKANHSIDVHGYFVWAQEKQSAVPRAAAAAAAAARAHDLQLAGAGEEDLITEVVLNAVTGADGSLRNGDSIGAASTARQRQLAGWLGARLAATYP